MFAKLRPYGQSASSPIAWAPELPAHWAVRRAKSLFAKVEREPRADDGVVTCFRDGVVTLRSRRRTTGFTESLKEIGYQGIRNGDLVIHAMDAFAGAAGVSDSDGKATPVYSVCVPRGDANPHYYAAVVREMARSMWIQALSRGIRERSTDFRFDTFATQMLPVPPADEQAAIVKYLAHANARIDKAIAAKRRLIALLLESRAQAVDTLVLGREMSERAASSSPWLDSIPVGWQWRRCRTLTSFVTSGSRGWAEYYSEDGPMFLQSGNLGRQLDLKLGEVQRVALPSSMTEGLRTRVEGRDILICITGALTGNVALVPQDWDEEAYINQHVALVRPRHDVVNAEFLGYAMKSLPSQVQFRGSEYGGTKQGLGLDEVKNLEVLVPSLNEQQAIVEEIRVDTRRIDAAIVRAEREVALLAEFRACLVADVVTGQVDVRAISASLVEMDLERPAVDRPADVEDLMEMSEV
ncbi:restriction endonuclease subunit S [Kribbella sp. NPDC050459]|uniref:restriction endonuclease subunit S n=1 Tax=Kribbella sp. NPDC050459 TaxID=3155785 RepID=UPI0033DB07E2